jgi:hypothetical protein
VKIIVLHGDDTHKSYARLTTFIDTAKKRDWDVADFDLDSILNQSLFEKERFYILKDFKKLDKKTLEKLEGLTGNLIVYATSTINATTLKSINASKVEKFELPQLLWKFLDSFSVQIFQELVKTVPAEYILAMMAWKLRKKYQTNPTSQVAKMISDLAEIDVKSKTGKVSLKESLDLLLIKRLA